MSTRLLRRVNGLLAALMGLVVILAGPGTATADTIQETRTLYVDVIFCDDEAEIGSDEVSLLVNGNWVGSRTNMDGGDWWDIKREFPVNGTATIELNEWSGWTIGSSIIYDWEAGLGAQYKHYFGHQWSAYHYRVLYIVT